jgi:uncharacterized protein
MKLKYPALLALLCASFAQASEAASLFINEIHYDNDGADVGEAVEIAGPAGTDLSGMSLVLYNGNGGVVYGSNTVLSGTISDQQNGFGTISFSIAGMQNGAPDGLALVAADGVTVLQFLSYEGVMNATDGPAIGLTSTDILVSETSTTPVGQSLQLVGTGTLSSDFSWAAPATSSFDSVNSGQTFGAGGGVDPVSACLNCPPLDKIADASTFNDASYYADAITAVVNNHTAGEIKTALNTIITANHKVLTYAEVWTALTETDEDPNNSDNVILLYKGTSIAKALNGSAEQSSDPDNWNREHVWPNSHGFGDQQFEAYTDIHHLRPADISVNGSRGNLDFDNSDAPLTEAPSNNIDSDSFEPRNEVKGDVARMMFYVDTRYQGFDTYTPALELVDRLTTVGEPALGRLCRLIEWSNLDPVDLVERNRNDKIYEYQGNRNPYIDHPEWVALLYQTAACADLGGVDPVPDPDPIGGESGTAATALVFINEIHYDNTGGDVGEAIEIAGPAGTDIGGLSLVLYNGSNGTSYNTNALAGIIPNQQNGFGTLSFSYPANGLQNGAPDGIALVDAEGNVLQFLSYEGVMTATDGPAVGLESTDIGVAEVSSTALGFSLQLGGTGYLYTDFSWEEAAGNTFELINTNQNFVAPKPFINEIHYDNAGGDVDEGVEIAGLAGIDLSGMSLVPYNGSNGTSYSITNLSGLIPNQQSGFGTLFFPIVGLQNGAPDGVALVDAEGNVIQFLSYEGAFSATNGPALGMLSTDIGVAETSSTGVGMSLQLGGSGFAYADFSWQDADTETANNINNNQTFGAGGGNGGPVDSVLLGQCGAPATLISAVQGNTDVSPLLGETHVIEGVVTGSFANLSGYFVQEESADEDGDAATSEGVFVYSPSLALPATGKIVRVLGEVAEAFEKTQLVVRELNPDCGDSSVTVTMLYLPFNSADSLEALEGMLVSNGGDLTVTDNYSLGRYGEVKLSNGRLFIPTNLFPAGSPEAINLAAQNALNQITLDDGVNGQNPETVIYPTGGLSANNTLRGGDTVSAVTGVIDYSFNLYRIIPIEQPTFAASNPRTVAPELAAGNLKVASLNVLNLFNGDGLSGGFPTSRGADSVVEYERQVVKTVAALAAIDADIVGLMEIENDGFDANSAIADLVNRLNQVVGADTYAFINAGGQIGTDEIKVAMLYKVGTVNPVDTFKILDSSNSIADSDGPLFIDTRNRPSFNQKFALAANGEEIVISVNHLKSKGSGCGNGDDDTTTGQGNCNLTRTRAAQALTAFLADQFTDTPTLIIGDLNSYAMEDPILKIQEAGYTNLANKFKGAEAYSYAFGGEYGYLDHALANELLVDKVVDTTEWHINADEPTVFDYNVEFKSEQQLIDFYATDAYRMSDHDPVVISILLEAAAVAGDFDGDGDVDSYDIRALLLAIRAGAEIDMFYDLDSDGDVDVADSRLLRNLCTRQYCRDRDL